MKKVSLTYLIGLLLAIFFLANATLVLGSEEVPPFTSTGSMGTGRTYHTATMLQNGKVLIVGGMDWSLGDISFSSAELYDPVTEIFSPTGSMGTARSKHTATLLPSGKVLIAAGSPVSYVTTNSAELYDPATETFTPTGSLMTTRAEHTATLLPNGKVLIAGGGNWIEGILSSAELYDPATETFTSTGSMATGRIYITATILPSGKVLIVGGYNGGALGSVELYDPATGTFSPTGSLETARDVHTATLLPNGKVLIAAGGNNESLTSAELYDPIAGAFTAAGNMVTKRINHTATLLASGKVLIVGGASWPSTNSLTSAELYWDIANVPTPENIDTSPAKLWIGLKNSDDQGTQFDLRTELYLNDVIFAEGETLCITGVTRNPAYAKDVIVPFVPVSSGAYKPEDVLSLRVLTRIGTNPNGSKCSGPGGSHNNAVGLRLYFDSPTRPSGFGTEIYPDSVQNIFLHFASETYFLNDVSPTGTTKYKDSSNVNYNNGNSWKEVGTWEMVP